MNDKIGEKVTIRGIRIFRKIKQSVDEGYPSLYLYSILHVLIFQLDEASSQLHSLLEIIH